MRRLLALPAIVLVAGCGSSGGGGAGTTKTARTQPTATTRTLTAPPDTGGASAGCRSVPPPKPRGNGHLHAPALHLDPAKHYEVTFATNCGAFTVRLDVARAPKTAASFWSLAKRGFYTGLTFHRVAQGFVVQGGDPTGKGSGGPGYTVVEPPPHSLRYTRGIVAMAKTGSQPRGASGSQFFVVTAPNAQLPPDYALVGKVVRGMAAVGNLERNPTQPPGDGTPQEPLVMQKVTAAVR